MIIGSHRYEDIQVDEGWAFVYHGSAAGLPPSESVKLVGFFASGSYGTVVGGAGDANGDGFADLIVRESLNDRVYLHFGNTPSMVGIDRRLQMRRFDDSAPIEPLGSSDEPDRFSVALRRESSSGRGEVAWEIAHAMEMPGRSMRATAELMSWQLLTR